jgi:hypothetical protein
MDIMDAKKLREYFQESSRCHEGPREDLYFGWCKHGYKYGWYVRTFGVSYEWFLGRNAQDAYDTLTAAAESRY